MKPFRLLLSAAITGILIFPGSTLPPLGVVQAETLELFEDPETGQLFRSAGPGRRKIGDVELPTFNEAQAKEAQFKAAPAKTSPKEKSPAERLPAETATGGSKSTANKTLDELISLSGYLQLRDSYLGDKSGADWYHPADRSLAENEGFLLRRGRISMKIEPHPDLTVRIQPDLSSKPGPGDYSVQLRDLYADWAINESRTTRLRFGQTIIPFGFVNLQSSRLRGPMERPEALNSGAEGERDLGVFMLWTPLEIQKRFKLLTENGYKGSGDFGVLAGGVYNGQGLNRSDENDEPHGIVRAAYPFEVAPEQYLEPHVSAFYGKYVPEVELIEGFDRLPAVAANGVEDARIAFGATWHPNPIGFELEWNTGVGPELASDLSEISSESLSGGYALVNLRTSMFSLPTTPFLRWQSYRGGRKFTANAPTVRVEDFSLGTQISLMDSLILSGEYVVTVRRTESKTAPYTDLTDGQHVTLQLQAMF